MNYIALNKEVNYVGMGFYDQRITVAGNSSKVSTLEVEVLSSVL